MAWTQTDYDTLKSAVASGVLTVAISTAAGTRSTTFQSLTEMRSLLAEMAVSLGINTTSVPSYRLAQTSKGVT